MAKIGSILITAFLLVSQSVFAQPKTPPTAQPQSAKAAKLPDASDKAPDAVPAQKSATKACLITLAGTIDGGLKRSLERRVKVAQEAGCNLIFFKIDTPGGGLFVAFDICDIITDLSGVKTVAYIPDKAISAGAMIAVACNEIVMGPDSYVGDCEPIIQHPQKGIITMPEKIQTMLRARFRSMADRNGYPVLLAEAMVTKEIEIYRVTIGDTTTFMTKTDLDDLTEKEKERIVRKKRVVAKDRLLTMHEKEAKELGFAKAIVATEDELFGLYNLRKSDVLVLETSATEETARSLDALSPLLLAVGLIALYIELKIPGFGLPGITAIACFVMLFVAKYFMGLAENWEVLVFILGIALLAVEIFVIPGFGIAGIAGISLIVIALILSFQPFVIPRTPFEVEMTKAALLKVLGSISASIVGMCILARYLPETSIFSRIVLKSAESADTGYVVESAERQDLVGQKGVTVSTLRPVGRAEIGNEVLSVVTQGEMVGKGRMVRVLEVKGNRIVVRET